MAKRTGRRALVETLEGRTRGTNLSNDHRKSESWRENRYYARPPGTSPDQPEARPGAAPAKRVSRLSRGRSIDPVDAFHVYFIFLHVEPGWHACKDRIGRGTRRGERLLTYDHTCVLSVRTKTRRAP